MNTVTKKPSPVAAKKPIEKPIEKAEMVEESEEVITNPNPSIKDLLNHQKAMRGEK